MFSLTTSTLISRQDSEDAVAYFRAHPDYRQVAAFILGWVFLSSLRHIWRSPFLRELTATLFEAVYALVRGQKSPEADREKSSSFYSRSTSQSGKLRRIEHSTLAFLLCLCFLLASLTQFLSLLYFDPSKGAVCAFVLGVGLITDQLGRVFGLAALTVELRRCGARVWEAWLIAAFSIASLGLIATTVGIALGEVRGVPNLEVGICVQRHFFPTSIAASGIDLILEMYSLLRMVSLVEPSLRFLVLQDIRIRRAASLILMDLIILVPRAISTNVLGDFLPFCFGAVVVLSAFGSKTIPMETSRRVPETPAFLDTRPMSFVTGRGSPVMSSVAPGPRSVQLSSDAQSGEFVIESQNSEQGSWVSVHAPSQRDGSIAGAVIQTAVRRPVPPHVPVDDATSLGLAPAVISPSEIPEELQAYNGKIIPSQTRFAAVWEVDLPLGLAPPPRSGRPPLSVETPPVSRRRLSPRASREEYITRSPGSTIFGSDIVRNLSQRKDRLGVSSAVDMPPSRRGSVFPSPVSQRPSWISAHVVPDNNLPVVHEADASSLALTFGRNRASFKFPEESPTSFYPSEPHPSLSPLPTPWMSRPFRPVLRGPRPLPAVSPLPPLTL
ncbi:hypothetical protein OF83DRAFT_485857 [Amylostereum chailletii]|nr:hypothetical protein OF83DRAFT_485857 [Amylostereum chailletii]